MVTVLMLEKGNVVSYSSFLFPNPTRNKFNESVGSNLKKKSLLIKNEDVVTLAN